MNHPQNGATPQAQTKARFWQLPGRRFAVKQPIEQCGECKSHHLYFQPDFRRSLGVWLVSIGSLATVVLFQMGYSWFVTWSPMLVVLLVDRAINRVIGFSVVCYMCESVHSGLERKVVLDHYPAFDLEVHDRLHYPQQEL